MAIYNDSFLDNATNILDIATGMGGAMGQPYLFGNLILFSFFMIFLILSYRHNFLEILIIDAFLTTVIAIMMFAAGLISALTIIYPFVIFIIGLIFYLFS